MYKLPISLVILVKILIIGLQIWSMLQIPLAAKNVQKKILKRFLICRGKFECPYHATLLVERVKSTVSVSDQFFLLVWRFACEN